MTNAHMHNSDPRLKHCCITTKQVYKNDRVYMYTAKHEQNEALEQLELKKDEVKRQSLIK